MGRPKGSKDKTKRKTRVHGWTPEELEILSANYYSMTGSQLATLLNKSYGTVRTRALKLELRKPCRVIPLCDIQTQWGKSGVYGLHNTTVNMWYIGSSNNMGKRLTTHVTTLRQHKHYNRDMQAAWSNGDQFEAAVFIDCKVSDLLRYEGQLLQMPNKYNKNSKFIRIPRNARDIAYSRINILDDSNECWLWTGYCKHNSYPEFQYDGKYYQAHRATYAYFNPDSDIDHHIVRHKCNNKRCCNPHHLELGSYHDNCQDYWDSIEEGARSKWYPQLDRIVELRLQNQTYQEIGDQLGCDDATIVRVIHKYRPDIAKMKMTCSANNIPKVVT